MKLTPTTILLSFQRQFLESDLFPHIPKLKSGTLGGKGFFSKTAGQRRRIESSLAHKIGEKKVQGKLQAIAVLNKNRNPVVMKKAQSDRSYIAGRFIGKKRVRYPKGFRRLR
jgi:hypothetical protein